MPRPRSLAGTLTSLPSSPSEKSTRSPTVIVPESGFSRPAMERKVVVLPQPDGPSRVNSSPVFDREAHVVDGEYPCGGVVAVVVVALGGAASTFLALPG